jgi:hypothetical protein
MKRLAGLVVVTLTCVGSAHSQTDPASSIEQPPSSETSTIEQPPPIETTRSEQVPKRIFGIVPNFRTAPTLQEYKPITPKEKFKIATQDSFDRGTVLLAALFAGQAHLTKSSPSFGQGPSGYARYFGASFADFAIGNYMTEAVYPTILHQDPRYFRRGSGGAWSRLGSAVSQIFWTRSDSGGMRFNFPETLGNATGVAISNVYYPDNRNASDAVTRFGIQIGVDIASNILKEFAPDLTGMFSRKHRERDSSKK